MFPDNYMSHFVLVGADVNQIKRSDWTPLMLVCTKLGSAALETLRVLLNCKADPHITNKDGWTALHIACRTGHCDTVKLLLENFRALANVRSNNGRYPLHIAGKYCTVLFHTLIDFCKVAMVFNICHYTCSYVPLCTYVCEVQTQACMHLVTNF
jgi:hypothetical protein